MGSTRTPTVDQFTAALLGLAIGDALGRPVEGKMQPEIRIRPRGELLAFRGYRDGRLGRELPPGSWSDDTQQALALAESLVHCGRLDGLDLSNRLYALWKSGEARGYGRVYQKSMERRDAGLPWDVVAVDDDTMNGAAMRIAPLGLFYWFDADALTEAAVRSSHVTHCHAAAVAGAVGVAQAFGYALTHEQLDAPALVDRLRRHTGSLHAETAEHLHVLLRVVELPLDKAFTALSVVPEFASPRGAGVSGLTIGLLLVSLYLWLHSNGNYLQAVEDAILLGGDTDGNAATAGALCAVWRGSSALPAELAATVEDADRIRNLAAELHAASLAARTGILRQEV